MSKGKITIVLGGQFGSEAKGAVTAYLARRVDPDKPFMVIRTGGPNAGHTVMDDQGVLHKLRHVPTPVVLDWNPIMALAARSVVDLAVLDEEISAWPGRIIYLDPHATILSANDIEFEQGNTTMGSIGSTRKGIGSARARRIQRTALTAEMVDPPGRQIRVVDTAKMAGQILRNGGEVMIEAAQGYGLGLHTRFYPWTTSADCTAIDALADCRINPWEFGITPQIWLVMRPYPIRVAGTSGPLKGETSWADLGLPEERTTVTNRIRRVGKWDPDLAAEAVRANGGPHSVDIALTMMDHIAPELYEVTDWSTVASHPKAIAMFQRVLRDTKVIPLLIGTGPGSIACSPALNDVREPV